MRKEIQLPETDMKKTAQALQINPPDICEEIEELIRSILENLHRDGAVVGLSGGLDSAVVATLTVRSLGVDIVHLLNMPERDSKPLHRRHAGQLAEHLGVPLTVKSITPILRALGSYRLLPLHLVPGRKLRTLLVEFGKAKFLQNGEKSLLADRLQPEANSWLAKGNAYVLAKHRIRMVVLYQYAEVHNLMVVGAANRTEWLTGTFSKWGVDHCADVMPLIHLYCSQLEQIAEYLQVPEYIRTKAADPDLIPGIDDKGTLLGDFASIDQILYGIEKQIDIEELNRAFGREQVERILKLWELSKHMRESPYSFLETNK
jgi:NAD+ synthase